MKNTEITLVILQDGKKVNEETGAHVWEKLAMILIADRRGLKLNGQRITIRTNYKTGGDTVTTKFITNGYKMEYIFTF